MSSDLGTRPGLRQPGAQTRSAVGWRSSWASALRLARRDIGKHKGRSLLVVLLVGLPVLAISFGVSVYSTVSISAVEAIPREMGSAQALIPGSQISTGGVLQDADGEGFGNADGLLERQPGYGPRAPWTASRIQQLTGGTVLQTGSAHAQVTLGDRHVAADVLGIDGRSGIATGMASLTSGRWPRSPDEVLVGPALRAQGVPAHGHIALVTPSGQTIDLTAVGTATGYASPTTAAGLIGLPALANRVDSTAGTAYLIARSRPMPWSEVKHLNTYGLLVRSREVIEHPGQAEADVRANGMQGTSNALGIEIVVLIAIGMVLETTLLAGPAFAVSAARQRRTFAMIASNGAVAGQLRRFVLAQAVILGTGAAVFGGVLGTTIGAFGATLWARLHPALVIGPPDVIWRAVIGITVVAAIASLVAAYLPSRGVTRIDLMGALRGRGVSGRRVRAGWPLVGLVLAVVGGFVTATAISGQGKEINVAVGAVVMFTGALFTIPWILSHVGSLAGRLPLPVQLRLAVRDVGRQRGRSVPAVAAIMASVTTLTALAIGGFSDQAQARAEYQPAMPYGQGRVTGGDSSGNNATWVSATTAVIHKFAPSLLISHDLLAGHPPDGRWSPKTLLIRAVPMGCTQHDVLAGTHAYDRCATISVDAYDAGIAVVASTDPANAVALSSQDRALLRAGHVLTSRKRLIHHGEITLLDGYVSGNAPPGSASRMKLHSRHELPATYVPNKTLRGGNANSGVCVIVSADTARKLGWPTYTDALQLIPPTGSISAATEHDVAQRLPDQANLYVERGYHSDNPLVFGLLFGVFGLLVLIGTLISTALAQAEARPDLGTLAAVGAPATLRRTVAGAQAFTVGVIGGLLGVAIGMVPGIAVTWPLTVTQNVVDGHTVQTGPYIDIPWLPLAAVVVAVPLLAGLLAAASIRPTPPMTRRAQ